MPNTIKATTEMATKLESYNLACALRDLKSDVTLFANDLAVQFTNNKAESDLRMVKLQL